MKLTFLGTGSGTPTRARNVGAIALQLPERAEWWLFDCGEGTQHQILRVPHLRLSRLTRVFLTHLHGDHLFGLPGLLASRSLAGGGTVPVTLHGPPGLADFVRAAFAVSQTRLGYPLRVETIPPAGPVLDEADLRVECAPLAHGGIGSWGYAVVEKEQPGQLDAARALSLGVPAGPDLGRLKRGETVVLGDGRTVRGTDLLGPPRPGRRVVLCGDTTYTPTAVALARGADLLVHEATFCEADRPLAERAGHSTAAQAARVAREAGGVKALVLTHFSPRYEGEAFGNTDGLLAEAQSVFPDTRLARDFLTLAVPRPESGCDV
jgi:ribonuclease Z